jgi:hypothetical protein
MEQSMRVSTYHSHLNGHEWLLVQHPDIWKEIEHTLALIGVAHHPPAKAGGACPAVPSPRCIQACLSLGFQAAGWSPLHAPRCALHVEQAADPTTSRGRATRSPVHPHLVKGRIAMDVFCTVAGDLPGAAYAQHLAQYIGDVIDLGIEILPIKSLQSQMASGPGYYEGALYDIARQGRGSPPVPLIVIGVEP